MREGVPVGIGGGQTGEDHVSRVHGVFGMRGSVSGGRSIAAWAERRANADVGVRGRSGRVVRRDGGVCEDDGTLEIRNSAVGVSAVDAWNRGDIAGYMEGYWKSDVPSSVYQQLVPHANEASHPMPGDPGLSE